ncbi:MAG TPA: MarR family transcriptional regulator [Gemmatimonadaceae bacterium]
MPRASKEKAALAADVWRRLFDLMISGVDHRARVLAKHGLTPNESRALHTLDLHEGRTMRALAQAWACDASNATWIVDRLEARGFAERRAKPGDRRVKLVVLTAAGAKTLRKVREAMYEPTAELRALPVETLEALRAALARLPEPGKD